jgi:hypothetical protein
MPPLTAAEKFSASIRAIKGSIGTVAGTAAPKASIILRRIFDEDADSWVGDLRSDADLDGNGDKRVNAIQIRYDGLDQDESAPNQHVNPLLPFEVSFFYGYNKGTNADNSEERLQKQIAEVVWALAASTDLGMNDVDDQDVRGCVMGHNGLTVPKIRLVQFGSFPLHLAIGSFEVRMQSRYVRA